MNIYLCGYNKIGCDVLNYLLNDCLFVENIAVFTHKPNMLHIPDIRDIASKAGLWHTTKSVNDIEAPFKPDIIASVYYRNIIKDHIIDKAKQGCFNIHPSLLPKHRGCSSIPWAIIEGDKLTGVTFHYIDKNIDTGNIILQASIQIDQQETQKILYEKCMRKGAEYWPAAFHLVCNNFKGFPQEGLGNYNKRGVPYEGTIEDFFAKEENVLDWRIKLDRFLRAMNYPPYPYATYKGIEVKTLEEFAKLEYNICKEIKNG